MNNERMTVFLLMRLFQLLGFPAVPIFVIPDQGFPWHAVLHKECSSEWICAVVKLNLCC